MGADIFHKDCIYRIGINDKQKHLALALDDSDPTVGQLSTIVYYCYNKMIMGSPQKWGLESISARSQGTERISSNQR